MYATALQQTTQQQLREWHDLWFNEYKKAGYVAITSNFKRHFFYGNNDIQKVIHATAGKRKQFISVNSFDVNWKEKEFTRQTKSLKQIRNIAIDIDQYNLNLTIDEALDEISALVVTNKIPEPNLILTSRGIQLFYSIDRGASPDISWLASYITEQLISKLQHIGADSNAKDMSRVMRVPNSINERNNAVVQPSIWNDTPYSLQELQSYCRPLEKFETRKQTKGKVLPLNKRLAFFYQTNFARLSDLHKLLELREGDFTGMRNVFLYMYSYHQSLVLNTQKDVIASVKNTFKDVYSRTDKPMTNKAIETTIKSAYKDAKEFFEHYKANNYKVIYKHNDGIKKPYKTSNLIDKLAITEKEQLEMRSIRNEEVAKKQHADYMREKRLRDGTHKTNRQEYEQERKDQQAARVAKLADLLEQYPNATQQEYADMIGVSLRTVKSYIKAINQ